MCRDLRVGENTLRCRERRSISISLRGSLGAMRYSNRDYTAARQRELRKRATDAEIAMWEILRDRRLCGVKFRRQHRVGPFILDFFSTKNQFAVELDGAEHFTESGNRNDTIRTSFLNERGIRVLRFENSDVLVNPHLVVLRVTRERQSLAPRSGERVAPIRRSAPQDKLRAG